MNGIQVAGSLSCGRETHELSPTPMLLSSASVVMTRTAEEQTACAVSHN
jgi:hypothetical protein